MSEVAPLSMWVVYDHPKDYPDWFVARKWNVGAEGEAPTDEVMRHNELDGLRETLDFMGYTCLQREEGDDPCIVETWL